MQILEVTWQHRSDYKARMGCEHCGHVQMDNCGYAEGFYETRVVPAMYCQGCGKNAAGETRGQVLAQQSQEEQQ